MAFGGTVKLTGESEYRKALADITSNLKVLNSEMKIVTSQYDKNDKSTSNLSQQNEVLNKKIAEQKDKVAVLTQALADAEQETGENSETSKKWRVELNNAQAELNKLEKSVDDNEKAMKDSATATDKNTDAIDKFGKEAEDSGNSVLKLGDLIKANLISDAVKAGIRGLASAIKGVGSAFISLGKQALESYGQYEQLVGGVDTLFGASSKTIQEYANNAYKTAGLSANQYMETVTSFSASLIASLDGDTAKASEVANRAIIDMSDNANKMGTSMEMIQNAYQGFAKQNYTMLDNLKLGYGGTKGEMQRLIKEASQMTEVQKKLGITVDETDMSFANIANAISVVQANMGIAGTTTAEASKTMQGSVSAMKASWQNLITGLADENANFDQLINNLVTSIAGEGGEGGVLSNFLPRISTALDGIVEMVVRLAETLLPKVLDMAVDLISTLAQGISTGLPKVISAISSAIPTLLSVLSSQLPVIISTVMSLIPQLVSMLAGAIPVLLETVLGIVVQVISSLSETLPQILTTIVGLIPQVLTTILDSLPLLIEAVLSLVLSIVQALPTIIQNLILALPSIIQSIVNALLGAIPLLLQTAIQLLMCIVQAIPTIIKALVTALPEIIKTILNGLLDALPKVLDGAIELLMSIVTAIPTIIEALIVEVPNLVITIISTLLSQLPNLLQSAVKLLMGIVQAIPTIVVELAKQVPKLITSIVSGLSSGISNVANVGRNLLQGLWNGMSGLSSWLWGKVKSMLSGLTSKIKSFFGIHSPSKLFQDEIGTNLALGLGEGFTDTMKDVTTDMTSAIPTEFDTNVSTNFNAGAGSSSSNYNMMVSAFKQALTEVKVVMNNREMGAFVTDTIERVVYT